MVRLPPPAFEVMYRAFSFPADVVAGSGKLLFTTDDLAHALIATGRAPGDRYPYGTASAYEWLHRASLVPAYVRRTYHGELTRSRLALDLDRSELVGLSYALGQAITAVFCRLELSVTHLMHVDRYANQYNLQFGGRKRADLFGLAPRGWVVAEAKGRSRSMESTLRSKLVMQKRSVLSIGGVRPWLALGCVASFPVRSAGMEIDAFDPERTEVDAIDLPATLDDYMLAYYLPFVTAINQGQTETRTDMIVTADFAGSGLRVGLLRTIYEQVQRAAGRETTGLGEVVEESLSDATAGAADMFADGAMFPDGTVVVTGWTEAIATRDWSL
jgi:hypothetical protein